jgi:hypothetical protein
MSDEDRPARPARQRMTRLVLLAPMQTPDGEVPAGTTMEVDPAEAARMLGAIGLARLETDDERAAARKAR